MATSIIKMQEGPRFKTLYTSSAGKTFTISADVRAVLELTGTTQGQSGIAFVKGSSSGTVYCFKLGFEQVTFDTSVSNQLTVTNTGGQRLFARIYTGDITETT